MTVIELITALQEIRAEDRDKEIKVMGCQMCVHNIDKDEPFVFYEKEVWIAIED
jgi:hypothetical protein